MYDRLFYSYLFLIFTSGMILPLVVEIPFRMIRKYKTTLAEEARVTATNWEDEYAQFETRLVNDAVKVQHLEAIDHHIRHMMQHRSRLEEAIRLEHDYKAYWTKRMRHVRVLVATIQELEMRFAELCQENKASEKEYAEKFASSKFLNHPANSNRTCMFTINN